MMTPKFEDVVDYVRTGEDDPEMKELLAQHPDGPELLKQARFIARNLQRKAEESDPFGMVADMDMVADSLEEPAAMMESRTFDESSMPAKRRRSMLPARSPTGDKTRDGEDLGTLELLSEGDRVTLSYEPSEEATSYFGKLLPEFAPAPSETQGIEIRGYGIRLSLPDSVTADQALAVRMAYGSRQMPAAGAKVIFMPESGPFVRFEADRDGLVQMPVPEEPGTLRIEAGATQILHIQPKT